MLTERCIHCDGTGTASINANFLLVRLHAARARDYRWVGISSDALVIAAIQGTEPTDRPYDGWDLGRCLITRAVAPAHLHEAMDAIIERWTELIRREAPHHGVAAAEKMYADEIDAVRAQIEALSC